MFVIRAAGRLAEFRQGDGQTLNLLCFCRQRATPLLLSTESTLGFCTKHLRGAQCVHGRLGRTIAFSGRLARSTYSWANCPVVVLETFYRMPAWLSKDVVSSLGKEFEVNTFRVHFGVGPKLGPAKCLFLIRAAGRLPQFRHINARGVEGVTESAMSNTKF